MGFYGIKTKKYVRNVQMQKWQKWCLRKIEYNIFKIPKDMRNVYY